MYTSSQSVVVVGDSAIGPRRWGDPGLAGRAAVTLWQDGRGTPSPVSLTAVGLAGVFTRLPELHEIVDPTLAALCIGWDDAPRDPPIRTWLDGASYVAELILSRVPADRFVVLLLEPPAGQAEAIAAHGGKPPPGTTWDATGLRWARRAHKGLAERLAKIHPELRILRRPVALADLMGLWPAPTVLDSCTTDLVSAWKPG